MYSKYNKPFISILTLLFMPFIITSLFGQARITFDYGKSMGNITHAASGFLHGFSDDAMVPPKDLDDKLYNPLHVKTLRASTGSVLAQYARDPKPVFIGTFSGSWGTYNKNKPAPYADWKKFESFVKKQVKTIKDAGIHPIYDSWNEPDKEYFLGKGGWPDATWDKYYELYEREYRIIRALDSKAKITAPGLACGAKPDTFYKLMDAFKDYCVKHDCVPDYWNFHFPGDNIFEEMEHIRGYNLSAGLLITEYLSKGFELFPSTVVYEISIFEEASAQPGKWGITLCTKANWGSSGAFRGSLGNTLSKNDSAYYRRGTWWVYEAYANMQGIRLNAKSPRDMHALASYDEKTGQTLILLGAKFGKGKKENYPGYKGPLTLILNNVSAEKPIADITVIPYADNGSVDERPKSKGVQITMNGNMAVNIFDKTFTGIK